jgi:forespore regulator of the sigma-K checkpoint
MRKKGRLLSFLVLFGGLTYIVLSIGYIKNGSSVTNPTIAPQEVKLTLKKAYVCGVEEEEQQTKMVASKDQIQKDYPDWQIVSNEGNTYTLEKNVQDLAPICKEKGYFGLSKSGVLTLFEGPPQDDKVIQTFFQINTKKLRSGLPPHELELLHQGIRIKDLAEYNSILSTYGEFEDVERSTS